MFRLELNHYVALKGVASATENDLRFCKECLSMLTTAGDINKNEVLKGVMHHPNIFIWGKKNASILGAHCLFYKGDASLTFNEYALSLGISNDLIDFVLGEGWQWNLKMAVNRLEYTINTGNVLKTERLPFQMHAEHCPCIGWNTMEKFHVSFDKKLKAPIKLIY